MRQTIEISVFLVLSLVAALAVHAWLASRNEQQRLTSALAAQKQVLEAATTREKTRDASLDAALAQIDKLKRDTQTPAQIVSGLSEYLSLPQPITLVAPQSLSTSAPANTSESQKGIGPSARQGTSASEKPPAPCETSSAQPGARITAKTHRVSRLAAGLKRKLRSFSGTHKVESGRASGPANSARPSSSGDSFVPNFLGQDSSNRTSGSSASGSSSSSGSLSNFTRNAQQGIGTPLPNGSASNHLAPKPDEFVASGSSLSNCVNRTEQEPCARQPVPLASDLSSESSRNSHIAPITPPSRLSHDPAQAPEPATPASSCAKSDECIAQVPLPYPGRLSQDQAQARAPTSASSCAKSEQCVAQIPVADLKPLYNYVQDCRACQTQLQAAKQNSADDALKLAALTRERDAAITDAKGGSFLRRLRRNALWLAPLALAATRLHAS